MVKEFVSYRMNEYEEEVGGRTGLGEQREREEDVEGGKETYMRRDDEDSTEVRRNERKRGRDEEGEEEGEEEEERSKRKMRREWDRLEGVGKMERVVQGERYWWRERQSWVKVAGTIWNEEEGRGEFEAEDGRVGKCEELSAQRTGERKKREIEHRLIEIGRGRVDKERVQREYEKEESRRGKVKGEGEVRKRKVERRRRESRKRMWEGEIDMFEGEIKGKEKTPRKRRRKGREEGGKVDAECKEGGEERAGAKGEEEKEEERERETEEEEDARQVRRRRINDGEGIEDEEWEGIREMYMQWCISEGERNVQESQTEE